MKETVTLTTSVSSTDAPAGWQRLAQSVVQPLDPAKTDVSPFGLVIDFVFHRYPAELDELRVALRRRGISANIYVRREYEPSELLESEFLVLRTTQEASSVEGTLRWDLAPVCPYCGFRETVWDLPRIRLEGRPSGFQLADVDYHPKVVSAMLAHQLGAAGLTGLSLIPLGENRSVGWYAVSVRHELPPMASPPTRLSFSPRTPTCERNHGLGMTRSEVFYRRSEFYALDFNRTHEIFGDSEATGRPLIVSNRVYRLLVNLGVAKLTCEPVRLLD